MKIGTIGIFEYKEPFNWSSTLVDLRLFEHAFERKHRLSATL